MTTGERATSALGGGSPAPSEPGPGAAAAATDTLVDEVAEWLVSQSLGQHDVAATFEGCCTRLLAAGIPLSRALVSFRTLHPLFASVTIIWRRGESVGTTEHLHGEAFSSREWRESPMHHMLESQVPYLRRRLRGDDAVVDFPVLREFQAAGATDYVGYLVPFASDDQPGPHSDGIVGSWCTDHRAGFNERQVASLRRMQRRLAVACKVQIKDEVARTVLATYLGEDAGRQVLEGRIRRGAVEPLHAVIWYSDMRSSTMLADTLSTEAFMEVLNAYFECTAGAVLDHGGEVLRFIGDAVLAIFPIRARSAGSRWACDKALDAARDAELRMAALNRRLARSDGAPIDFGLGLHVGDVMFGNIGVPRRLEFSVTGPAVNEVARLEDLTKSTGRRVLVSGDFAAVLAVAWEPLGEHRLRGVDEPMMVFAPPPFTVPTATLA